MQNYSVKVVQANKLANSTLLGVQLGRLCIFNNIPVREVANKVEVTRSTVYGWFMGKTDVGKHLRSKVEAYYRSLPPAEPPAPSAPSVV